MSLSTEEKNIIDNVINKYWLRSMFGGSYCESELMTLIIEAFSNVGITLKFINSEFNEDVEEYMKDKLKSLEE